MVDDYIRTFDFDAIEKNKKQIIESFVAIYGEERRKEIEEKISNVVIIPYMSIESLQKTIKTIKQNKSTEIIERVKDKFDEELIKKIFNKYDFNDSVIFKYYEYVDKVKETNDRSIRVPFDLIFIDKSIDADAILDNKPTDIMKIMDDLRPYIMDLRNEYEGTLDRIKDQQEMLDKVKAKEDELKDKYVFEFATKYKDYLGEEYDKIEKNYNIGNLRFISHPKLDNLIGLNFSYMTPIDSFSEKSNEELDYYTKSQRIQYFHEMGIDLGDDYATYENDERCKQIWPSKTFVEQVKKDREEIIKKHLQEVYLSYPPYVSAMETIGKYNLKEDMGALENYFMMGATALNPNVKRGENGLEPIPFIFVNMARSEPAKLDVAIFHELNHLIEYRPLSITEESFEAISGWDLTKSNYVAEDISHQEKREYELFNEIINDLLAEQVARDFHLKGNSIVSNPTTANYVSCGYRATRFLVDEFFEKYYEQIIASRSSNIEIIFDTVGKENFDELNALFEEYETNFGGFKAIQLYTDRQEGKVTVATKKMDEIIKRRDESLRKMEEYSKTPMVM